MKIKIKDTEIELRYTMRLYLVYEAIAGKSLNYSEMTVSDVCQLFYATLMATFMANRSDIQIEYDDFLDMLDEGGEKLINEFTYWFLTQLKRNQELIPAEEETKKPKSKKK